MRKSEWMVVLAVVLALCLPVPSFAGEIAQIDLGSAAARWDVQGSYAKVVLTVSLPNGSVIRREFKGGDPVVFELDAAAKDGSYTYELRGVPHIDASARKELAAARKAGNEAAVIERLTDAGRLPREAVQSGAFLVKDGAIVPGDQEERPRGTAAAAGIGVITAADQVIPDDLIVQGSECVGLDCVNNENFGFDTIRLKENNLRIHFDDTSSQAGFPANDWRLIANDSASGGSSKFSIEDSTSAKTPFTITAGAATNSIFVDSTGRLGLRTSTPVLDLHINTSNTPAIRLEQNNSGGFTAQTWDIGANEANFFVRDVTGGSKLSLRIRPGAPTSSLDISSDGDVGIGTASPITKLHVLGNVAGDTVTVLENSSATGFSGFSMDDETSTNGAFIGLDNAGNTLRINSVNNNPLVIQTNSTERIRFPSPGTDVIQATNGAELTAGGVWQDNSRRASKRDIVELSETAAIEAFQELNPVTFRYLAEPDEEYVGFIAEDLPDLVATNDRQHMNSTDVVAVLTKVVQQQQKTIEDLSARLAELEKEKQ